MNEDMLLILFGQATVDFFDRGKVRISLTPKERWELLRAIVKSAIHGEAPAFYMSAELENVLCGASPDRYTKI